jgi:hypothetical protein
MNAPEDRLGVKRELPFIGLMSPSADCRHASQADDENGQRGAGDQPTDRVGRHPCLRANASWHVASFSEMPSKDDARSAFQPASKARSMQWNRRRSINPA